MTASPSPSSSADVLARLRRLAQAGIDIAATVERGQGDGPLARHFRELADDLQSGPFRLVVLGLDPEARGRALAALCGQDVRVVRLQIPEEVGVVDIRFGERGYVLQGRDGARQQFDQLEPFLAAVEQADLVRDGDPTAFVAPMSLQLPASRSAQGLHLLVPESLAALRRNPRLAARLVAHANVLVLAGGPSVALAEADAQALRDLAEAMTVVQPMVFAEAALPARGYWSDRALLPTRELLPPFRGADGEAPALARDPQDPLRAATTAAAHAARLRAAATMVRSELAEDRGQVDVRLRSMQREQKAIDEAQRERNLRAQVDQLRTPAFDALRRLGETSAEELRRAGIAGGPLEAASAEAVAAIVASDLEREPLSAKKVRLCVATDALETCRRRIYEALARACKSQATLLREGAGALEAQVATGLTKLRGASVSVRLPAFDEERVRHAIKELLQSDLEAKAEIDRRGFWKRMAHGRQLIFTILMTVSLFGGIVGIERQHVLRFILPLFVLGVAMTAVTFRREEREQVDKELDRMREQLASQLQRRSADALRELGERVHRQLDELKEQMQRQIEAVSRDADEHATARARDDLRELQQRLRVQEQRRRDLDGLLQRSQELERGVADAERDAAIAVVAAVRAAAAAARPAGGGKA